MPPIITLTTDFATTDGYIGAMKGRLLSICREALLVDISHAIAPQDVRGASQCLARAVPEFPEESIHLAVVDPGVGSVRQPLLLRWQDRWLIGPDNGLFGGLLAMEAAQACYRIRQETTHWRAHTSFDGLHLFAPAVAWLARGLALAEIAEPIDNPLTHLRWPQPRREKNGWTGEILGFDHFGNALTNLPADRLASPCSIHCAGRTWPLSTHYAAVECGGALALINSDGMLELACRDGNAQQTFGLAPGKTVLISEPV